MMYVPTRLPALCFYKHPSYVSHRAEIPEISLSLNESLGPLLIHWHTRWLLETAVCIAYIMSYHSIHLCTAPFAEKMKYFLYF